MWAKWRSEDPGSALHWSKCWRGHAGLFSGLTVGLRRQSHKCCVFIIARCWRLKLLPMFVCVATQLLNHSTDILCNLLKVIIWCTSHSNSRWLPQLCSQQIQERLSLKINHFQLFLWALKQFQLLIVRYYFSFCLFVFKADLFWLFKKPKSYSSNSLFRICIKGVFLSQFGEFWVTDHKTNKMFLPQLFTFIGPCFSLQIILLTYHEEL